MKLNKNQFKKILKECIRELISEGAFNKVIKENFENFELQPPRIAANGFIENENYAQNSPHSFAANSSQAPNQRLRELAKLTAFQAVKGDSSQATVMEQIFADTAVTTLQQQLGSEMGGGANIYVGQQQNPELEKADQVDLEALSGGRPKNHWAALAFGKYNK